MKVKKTTYNVSFGNLNNTMLYTAAQENQDVLTLERIYKENEFELNQFGPARWLEDGSGYTTLEESINFPKCKGHN